MKVLENKINERVNQESHPWHLECLQGPNQRYTAIARCIVEGGPEYDLKLIGKVSEIKYKLQVNEVIYAPSKIEFAIKFGEIPFNTSSKVDLFITPIFFIFPFI